MDRIVPTCRVVIDVRGIAVGAEIRAILQSFVVWRKKLGSHVLESIVFQHDAPLLQQPRRYQSCLVTNDEMNVARPYRDCGATLS